MIRTALVLSLILVSSAEGWAEDALSSAYTRFDSKSCRHRAGSDAEDYGSWTCPGHAGQAIRLSAGDQRMFVSFGPTRGVGPKRAEDLAARETFPAFNNVYSGTVEWRLKRKRPVAAILRWNVVTAGDSERATGPIEASGRVLVVTRLGPDGVCHVGYVDARANPDANALARSLADSRAETFRCGTDTPGVLGTVTPGLAMPHEKS